MTTMAWDAEVLSRVRHLQLTARHLTESLLQGNHRSRRVGPAVEFADYQEYVPGMDLRHLDWRVQARSDRFVVRRYETETELPSVVVLDLSGDLATGERAGQGTLPDLKGTKAGYGITLAACLLYWLHLQREPIGLEIVGGIGSPYTSLPPRTSRSHLQQCLLALATARPAGEAHLRRTLVEVGSRMRRRGFVALITDGMEEPAEWLPALGAFARRGTDLRFLHLFDRGELELDFSRPARFYSPEGGDPLAVDPAGARRAFREVLEEYLDEVRRGVLRWGGQYVAATTERPMAEVLQQVVAGASTQAGVPWA